MRQIRSVLRKDFTENRVSQWIMAILAVIFVACTVAIFTIALNTNDSKLFGIFMGMTIPCVAFATYTAGLPFGMIMRDTKVGWIRFLVSVGIPRQRIAQSKLIYCLIVCVIAWLLFAAPFGCYAYRMENFRYLVIIGYFAILPLSIAASLGGILMGLTLSPNMAAMLFSICNFLIIILAFTANIPMFLTPGNPSSGMENVNPNLMLGLALGVLIGTSVAAVGLYMGIRHVLVSKDM